MLRVVTVQVGVGVGDGEACLEDVEVVDVFVGVTAGRDLHLCMNLLCLAS